MPNSTRRYPVILFPGIAGSRLKTRKQYSQDAHPLWFNSLVLATMNDSPITVDQQDDDFAVASASIVESDKTEADLQETTSYLKPSEHWQEHMKLQSDGKTPIKEGDGDEKFNREVEGLDGIRNVHYPLGDNVPDPQSEYYKALVDKLKENGYTENVDLIGHPYDWRVAPGGLEQRYQTFTKLKAQIEELHTNSQLPVVLIAHSMGNRVVQYFLKWVEANESKAWIDEHIERYIAISPPWIGAPQAIYRLSDSAIVLPAGKSQVALVGMKDVLQSFSSIPWLLPLQDQYFNTQSFGYYNPHSARQNVVYCASPTD